MESKIKGILSTISHPETGENIISSGFLEGISIKDSGATITLRFKKARDPFAVKIKREAERALSEALPELSFLVIIKEGATKSAAEEHKELQQRQRKASTTSSIGKVIAISSGKGGVGKSTVTANLALTLRNMGYRVGVLDADIYGPSQPKMFGCEDYLPDAIKEGDVDRIIPADAAGVKLISIGFFIKPTDALVWRGTMANSALRQLIHQTQWGALDFLLIDLPPGTGDIHLSVLSEISVDGAVIVSTPQSIAVADVVRGVEMFRSESINVPILGIVENMAWFTPEELPENRYYIFGQGGAKRYAEECGVELLGELPIVQSIMEGADGGRPAVGVDSRVEAWYRDIADRIVSNLMKSC